MKAQNIATVILVLLLSAGSPEVVFAQQGDIFSYGSIPFGAGVGEIEERTGETLKRADSPGANFLAHDAIIRQAETDAASFFEPGIAASSSPGVAFVWLDEEYSVKYGVETDGSPRAELFFFSPQGSPAEGGLFIVYKRMRLSGRYLNVYDRIEESIRGRIGSLPKTYDGTFYGGALETYAILGFWSDEDVTVLLQVREANPQAETSVVDYIYIDTRLWREYRRAVSGAGSGESGSYGDAMESF